MSIIGNEYWDMMDKVTSSTDLDKENEYLRNFLNDFKHINCKNLGNIFTLILSKFDDSSKL
jgi:hypothetical protein